MADGGQSDKDVGIGYTHEVCIALNPRHRQYASTAKI